MRHRLPALLLSLAACKFPYPADVPDDDVSDPDAATLRGGETQAQGDRPPDRIRNRWLAGRARA
jgi:predicted small lipoprotein YifL